jgi:hypothetical protein
MSTKDKGEKEFDLTISTHIHRSIESHVFCLMPNGIKECGRQITLSKARENHLRAKQSRTEIVNRSVNRPNSSLFFFIFIFFLKKEKHLKPSFTMALKLLSCH